MRDRGAAAAVIAVVAIGIAGAVAVLSKSAPRIAEATNVRLLDYPVILQPDQEVCQRGDGVPEDAATLEVEAAPLATTGPPLDVRVGATSFRVKRGYTDERLRIPLRPGSEGAADVCIRNVGTGAVGLGGQDASAAIPGGLTLTVDGAPQAAALRLRWLTAPSTGWQLLDDAVERWGYVTALGPITPYLAMLLFGAAFAGALALAIHGRASAVACALVALASSAGWALTTPVFHVPDEPQHFAYLQRLAEGGEPPKPVPGPVFSDEEGVVFGEVGFNHVVGNPEDGRPPWSEAKDRAIDEALAREPGRFTEGGITNTTNNPPLYYLVQLGPYWSATAAGGDFLDRMLAVRLGSALLVALTAAFGFAFVRELLPGAPWAWTAGGLVPALHPLLGFIGGGVNNDAGLVAAAAAVFWLVARTFRRGLDRRGAVGIGLAVGLGLITKATILGLVPGLLLCAVLLLRRAHRAGRAAVLRNVSIAAVAASVPVVAYVVANEVIWDRGLWSGGGTVATTGSGRPSQLVEFLSYVWQFYLPRLPFMEDQQAGIPLYNVWLEGLVGRYGWLDTDFPGWAYGIAVGVFAAIISMVVAAGWRSRSTLREWGLEALGFAGMAAGLLLVIAWAGYRARLDTGDVFEQARYLLPLLALYGGVVALTARAAGRFGPPVAAGLVALACVHAAFSVGLVASRFYA